MFDRKRHGSVVCPSCGRLVGVDDDKCYHCGRPRPGMWGLTPLFQRLGRDFGFTQFVIGACVLLYGIALLLDPSQIRSGGMFSLFSPGTESLFLLGASGRIPVFGYGRWWTVLSAGFLHAGVLHILFNMLWVRQLAPATAGAYGPARMIIIYTVSSVTGFLASSVAGHYMGGFLGGAQLTVGASAPIFGLLGALVHYGRTRGGSVIGRQAVSYAIILGLFGFIFPGIDNWAHGGGFVGGYIASRLLNPWKTERIDHVIVAFVCIAAIVASVVASVVFGLPVLRG